MKIIRKIMIILWCVIVPTSAFGMKVTIGKPVADSVITLEFNMGHHDHKHEIYEIIQKAMDLIELIISKNYEEEGDLKYKKINFIKI